MQQRQNTLQFVYGSFYLHLSYTANQMIKELPYKNVLPQQLRGKNKNGNWKQKDEYFVLYNILRSTVLNAKIIPSFHSCYLLCMHFICQMARCIMFLFMRTYYIIFYFSLHCMHLLMCILLYFHHNMQLILAMISLYLFYCLYQVTSSYYFKEHVVFHLRYSQRLTS